MFTISIFNMISKLFFLVEICFLYVCMAPFGHCQSQNTTILKMDLVTSMGDKLITDIALWTRQGSGSKVGCASDCVRDHKCVSFFYNVNTDVCTAHSIQFYGTEPSLSDVGSLYYTISIDRDCADILATKPCSPDGVYVINPMDGMDVISVYCDMTTDGGGWTVFQRRQDGTVNFSLNWTEYKSGFGNLNGEFWLGNDIIHRLTAARPSQLRIDMKDQGDLLGYAKYSTFVVDSETKNYTLTVLGYTGNKGDSLTSFHNGMAFTTEDSDHDTASYNCAVSFDGGWWYRNCFWANLNGVYGNNNNGKGINWESWHGYSYSLKWTEMKLKPA